MNINDAVKTKKIKDIPLRELYNPISGMLRKMAVILRDNINAEDLKIITSSFCEKLKSDFPGLGIGEIGIVIDQVAYGEAGEIYRVNVQKIVCQLNKYKVSRKRYNATVSTSEIDRALPMDTERGTLDRLHEMAVIAFNHYKEHKELPELPPKSLVLEYFIRVGKIKKDDVECIVKSTIELLQKDQPGISYNEVYVSTCGDVIKEYFYAILSDK